MLIRVLSKLPHLTPWFAAQIPMSKILHDSFEIQANLDRPNSVSMYHCDSLAAEPSVVGAHFSLDMSSAESRFGLRIREDDCINCGMIVSSDEPGTTGIHSVDARHRNVIGTPVQFRNLITRTIRRLWLGEEVLRVYPMHLILSEIGILSLATEGIDESVRERCQRVLQLSGRYHRVDANTRTIVLCAPIEKDVGNLDDPLEVARNLE